MPERTQVVSVHILRRKARQVERDVQFLLDSGVRDEGMTGPQLPEWAKGVRVEKAGRFQHAVVATDTKGH